MDRLRLESCEFVTERLRVGPWHSVACQPDIDLDEIVAGILTERSTKALPDQWHGDFSVERARAWIQERDTESPTLLGVERQSGGAVALVMVHEIALDDAAFDVRIGYVIAEELSGRGLATELVEGLVNWAKAQPTIRTLTGGVNATNQASVRALLRNGFELIVSEAAEATYQRRVDSDI